MRRVAVYAATRARYDQMAVAARSLLLNTRMDRVIFLIEDDSFPEQLPPVIWTVNVGQQDWFNPDGPNSRTQWTYMALMRLVLPEMLQDETRCLWLDTDTICNRDIGGIFDMDLGDNLVAMVKEPGRSKAPFRYHNSGVILMNLDRLRICGLYRDWVRLVESQQLDTPDQDAINMLTQGRIMEISPEWNACNYTGQLASARIFHFAGMQPEQIRRSSRLWNEYAATSWEDLNGA